MHTYVYIYICIYTYIHTYMYMYVPASVKPSEIQTKGSPSFGDVLTHRSL